MQTLISGSDKAIDIEDWMANTNYGTGFDAEHDTIKIFWEVQCARQIVLLVFTATPERARKFTS